MAVSRSTKVTISALLITAGVSVADWLLPQEIETNFFYTLPLLLCMLSNSLRLPWVIALIAVSWTVFVDGWMVFVAREETTIVIYTTINDAFGLVSVIALAAFISSRIKKEQELRSIISFVDGRLRGSDNEKLSAMLGCIRDNSTIK